LFDRAHGSDFGGGIAHRPQRTRVRDRTRDRRILEHILCQHAGEAERLHQVLQGS
jgi:hypothetical protein